MSRWIPLAVFLAGSVSACGSDSLMMVPDGAEIAVDTAASVGSSVSGSCEVRLGSLSPAGLSDDPMLFSVGWGGASTRPEDQRFYSHPAQSEFFARALCPPGSPSWTMVFLDPEVATWEPRDCDWSLLVRLQLYDPDATMLCGVVMPVSHGRTELVVERGSDRASLAVVANRPPTYARDVPRIRVEMGVGESVTVDVGPHFMDPDGDPLELRIGRWPNSIPDFLDLELYYGTTMVQMTAIGEGRRQTAIPISASDGFHQTDMMVGLVQVGCPGLTDLPRGRGTGRIQVIYKTSPDYSACFHDVVWAAVAYWEDVLAGDSRHVEITFGPAPLSRTVSCWG